MSKKDLLTEENIREAYSSIVDGSMEDVMASLFSAYELDNVYIVAKTLFTNDEMKKAADDFFNSLELFNELKYFTIDELERINND